MLFGLLRAIGVIWFLGFIVLAAAATSSYLYSNENQPERGRRWHSRLRMSLIWPIALLSADGRSRLRRG
jgi:hypothetical protein